MKLEFHGAARTVTGSKHLLKLNNGRQILLDCGMYQGKESDDGRENRHFGFNPGAVDFIILSHAHIDHSGLLPRMVKEGFSGAIYSTAATRDLCEIMLADSAHIQESDAEYESRHRQKAGLPPIQALYEMEDVEKCLSLFKTLDYDQWHVLEEGIELMFTFVGHILGSAAINLKIKEEGKTHTICYTGDIGRTNHHVIKNPKPFPPADIIITEATYGDKLHDESERSKNLLLQIVKQTCIENQGKLIIPAFSLGRTQEIVFALDQLETEGKLPDIPVFVDSPLSTNATAIFNQHPECFNRALLDYLKKDDNPFGFSRLKYIREVKYSKLLNEIKEPCIILSASGMIEAGRILHHVRNNIEDPKNTILIVGYCEPSTIGGQLSDGATTIQIFGQTLEVNAKVEVLGSYSAHGDYKEMIHYLSCQNPETVKQMFLVHGNYQVQVAYRNRLLEEGYRDIEIPEQHSSYQID